MSHFFSMKTMFELFQVLVITNNEFQLLPFLKHKKVEKKTSIHGHIKFFMSLPWHPKKFN